MNVVITGAAGFLGARLARELLAAGPLPWRGDQPRPVTRITLADRARPPAELVADPRCHAVVGDLVELCAGDRLGLSTADVVFHLAGAVSAECEADLDLGLHANLSGGHELLQACRRAGRCPTVVFASSLAVFGLQPGESWPAVISDTTVATPRSSYGAQKLMVEILLADYSRRGLVDGRALRLMTVCVRPGKPNAAASGFVSGIIREPVHGQPATCPVPADTELAIASPQTTIAGLIRAALVPPGEWGPPTAVNTPGLTVTPREMVAALARVAGSEVADLISWGDDPAIRAIVSTWPARFEAARAASLGLPRDRDIDAVIRQYRSEHLA